MDYSKLDRVTEVCRFCKSYSRYMILTDRGPTPINLGYCSVNLCVKVKTDTCKKFVYKALWEPNVTFVKSLDEIPAPIKNLDAELREDANKKQ